MSTETTTDLITEVEAAHDQDRGLPGDIADTLVPLTPRSPILAPSQDTERERGRVTAVAVVEDLLPRNPNLTTNLKVLLKPLTIFGQPYLLLL